MFDEAGALKKFDDKEENAIVEIPAEIQNQEDGDWKMKDKEREDFIDRVLQSRDAWVNSHPFSHVYNISLTY